jgi:hydroxymethylpyrimidine pyrophosphatase-like HAD family hydrolase
MVFTRDNMMLAQPNEVGLKLRNQLEFEMPPVVGIDAMRSETVYQIIAIMPGEMDTTVGELLPHCRLPRWHPYFTDIVAHDNSKARGMEAICRHFGIRQEETLAFGDGANDIEMLEWAGIGVAMGNAADGVKQHADRVTSDVDHEGIEMAVNEIIDNS